MIGRTNASAGKKTAISVTVTGEGTDMVGGTVTLTNGSTVLTGITDSSGTYITAVEVAGTWTIAYVKGEKEASGSVTITTLGMTYPVSIAIAYPALYKLTINATTVLTDTASACTYGEMCAGFAKSTSAGLSSNWAGAFPFKDITYWTLNDDGSEYEQLNPNNLTLTVGGSASSITSKNVMAKIPTVWWKVVYSTTQTDIYISEIQWDSDFHAYAHEVDGTILDFVYWGVYLGYNSSSKMKSWSGVTPTDNTSTQNWYDYAIANNSSESPKKWRIEDFYDWSLLGILYLFAYGNTNGQTALGKGYTSRSSAATTGTTNTGGIAYGGSSPTSGTSQVKFIVEDVWGNLYTLLGFFLHGSGYLYAGRTRTWSTSQTGYTKLNSTAITTLGGVYPKICGPWGTDAPLVGNDSSGSQTTGLCDYQNVYTSDSNYVAHVGGGWSAGLVAGPFCFRAFSLALSDAYSPFSARLCRK